MLRLRLVVLLVLAALLAACGASEPASQAPAGTGASAVPSSAAPRTQPGDDPVSPEPASEPPPETSSPVPPPSPEATSEPSPSLGSGAAAECSGTAANRGFFAGAAAAVDWPVLCAVLPRGWFVNRGRYRLANGGWVTISYKGPGGATFALSEGSFCKNADGCVPPGSDAGDAELGSMAGTLVRLDGGGFAIVVDRGATPSWLLETHGLDEATTVSLGAALFEVGG